MRNFFISSMIYALTLLFWKLNLFELGIIFFPAFELDYCHVLAIFFFFPF